MQERKGERLVWSPSFAGITLIRFCGYNLSLPCAHCLKPWANTPGTAQN
jgi:hypothetical protein